MVYVAILSPTASLRAKSKTVHLLFGGKTMTPRSLHNSLFVQKAKAAHKSMSVMTMDAAE